MASISSNISTLSILLFFTFLFSTQPVFSADPPKNSPSPSPNPPADALPPPPPVLSPETASKSPSRSPSPDPPLSTSSPPAPPPSDLSPTPSPAPSPAVNNSSASDKAPTPSPSPSPAPSAEADASHEEMNATNIESKSDSGGMNGSQKAGVAVAVVAGACIVGVGALIYKKRQRNVRRAQFGYDSRIEIL